MSGLTHIPLSFLAGVVLYASVLIFVWSWESKNQLEFIGLVRTAADTEELLLPEELWRRYRRRPWAWFLEAPGLTLRHLAFVRSRSDNPLIESARRRMLTGYWLALTVTFTGLLLPFLLLAVLG
jgi:hypothetical protein